MPVCNETHGDPKHPAKHYYIAGACIHNSRVTIGFLSLLRQSYPYFHGDTYVKSIKMQKTPITSELPRSR